MRQTFVSDPPRLPRDALRALYRKAKPPTGQDLSMLFEDDVMLTEGGESPVRYESDFWDGPPTPSSTESSGSTVSSGSSSSSGNSSRSSSFSSRGGASLKPKCLLQTCRMWDSDDILAKLRTLSLPQLESLARANFLATLPECKTSLVLKIFTLIEHGAPEFRCPLCKQTNFDLVYLPLDPHAGPPTLLGFSCRTLRILGSGKYRSCGGFVTQAEAALGLVRDHEDVLEGLGIVATGVGL